MKRVVNSLKSAVRLSPEFGFAVLGYAIFPLLLLAGFGLYFIYTGGYGLQFLLGLLGVSLLPVIVMLIKAKQKQTVSDKKTTPVVNGLVKPSKDWGPGDLEVWGKLNNALNEKLDGQSQWSDLYHHSLDLITAVAAEYGKKELSFSIPELLVLSEEISRRYRAILSQHAPMIESLPCSAIKHAYDKQANYKTLAKVGQTLFDVYRGFRLATPVGIISEVKSQLLSHVFAHVGESLLVKLKHAFLQDVIAVAIDLYSGRFKVAEAELSSTNIAIEDRGRMAKPLDPMRVCVLGQVSAGKSSVINALKKEVSAEVDALPSTGQVTTYACSVEGDELLHLIDLPGLEGESKIENLLFNHIVQANLIVWVLKANQSARQLDTDFKQRFDQWFQKTENRLKQPPVIIGVLNQVDQLKPVTQWQPPYDLSCDSSPKATVIKQAVSYNKELLGFDVLIPLSVSAEREHFNVDVLEKQLVQFLEKGLNVQLNQRRLEADNKNNVQEQAQRILRFLQRFI